VDYSWLPQNRKLVLSRDEDTQDVIEHGASPAAHPTLPAKVQFVVHRGWPSHCSVPLTIPSPQ